MRRILFSACATAAFALVAVVACAATPTPTAPTAAGDSGLKVVAAETFLADIAQNVAGDRATVQSLLPLGTDPHGFEPVPADVVKVADSNLLIVNGAGIETFLDKLLSNAGGQRPVVTASAGLQPRTPKGAEGVADGEEADPHFWLDPNNVIAYVQNIRDGLTKADPAGAATYAANADAYIKKLQDLDEWIKEQVAQIPPAQRLLVTNHEALGYFADRYGLTVAGSIFQSVSTAASPSAQEFAQLIDHLKQTGAKAIFLEAGFNQQLASQVARETGAKIGPQLYTDSLSRGAPAATYIDMMKYMVTSIVNALK